MYPRGISPRYPFRENKLFLRLKGFTICTFYYSRICLVGTNCYFVECTVVFTATMMFTLCYGASNGFVGSTAICHIQFHYLSVRFPLEKSVYLLRTNINNHRLQIYVCSSRLKSRDFHDTDFSQQDFS